MLSWFCGTPRVDEWGLCILDVTITLRLPSFTMSKSSFGWHKRMSGNARLA